MAAPILGGIGAQGSATGAATINWPAHVSGLFSVLLIHHTGATVTPTQANGQLSTTGVFTNFLCNTPQVTGPGGDNGVCYSRWGVSTGTSDTSVVTNDMGDHAFGYIITFSGCNTSSPIHVDSSGSQTTSTSLSITGNTTTLTDILNVYLLAGAIDGTTNKIFDTNSPSNANLTSLTKQLDITSAVNNDGGQLAIVTGSLATPGALGTLTSTIQNNAVTWFQFALKSTTSSSAVTNTSKYFHFF